MVMNIQSSTSRVAPSVPGVGCESTALQPYQKVLLTVWELKMSSDVMSSTEASLHVDGGTASSGALNVPTDGLLGHSKSCVFIPLSL